MPVIRRTLTTLSEFGNTSKICKVSFSQSNRRLSNSLFDIHPNVSAALSARKPVVALESTIITHGMPYPHNLRTAQLIESIVREHNAIPATIAVLDGQIHVGLTEEQLQRLSSSSGQSVKISRRDLSPVLSQGGTGGTTVSGTMIIAQKVGIPVFVTGGIGGVHRGAETSMDISADLTELGRTPITVVSAGVKSILDIGKTLEYLETEGVTVATFGETKDFPAFFTSKSGHMAQYNVATPAEAGDLIVKHLSLGLQSGILIAVPIPDSEAGVGEDIEKAVQQALVEARRNGIMGKEVTPYILQRVYELTEGKSLDANIALIKNNAKVGSQIACEVAKLTQDKETSYQKSRCHTVNTRSKPPFGQTESHARPVVVGASIVDFMASIMQKDILYHGGTNPGSLKQTYGGVARNLTDCLSRLGTLPIFISAVGEDSNAENLLNYCRHMDTSYIQKLANQQTATYCVVLDSAGECLLGIGDTDITMAITPQLVGKFEKEISSAPLVCMDGNIPMDTIDYICDLCNHYGVPVWFEPTCVKKGQKPFLSGASKSITYISPNISELRNICSVLDENISTSTDQSGHTIEEVIALCQMVLQHVYCVLVTLGKDGVLVCRNSHKDKPSSSTESS
ncbi:uncharacterized protein [Ptychodera flava]|uniref:uncharacterized protein n=1 Tax=Ptychodera flava TaxID=63121 RepID=UPI00396A13F7